MLRPSRPRLAGLPLLALLLPLAACGPTWPSDLRPGDLPRVRTYLSDLLRARMAERNVTGLSIALVDDQAVLWAEGFGLADQARQTPARPDTLYQVGSVTKVLTAAAVAQLAQEGRLRLDQPVAELVPGFALGSRFPAAAPVTVRSLLAHHSGLPTDLLQGMWDDQPVSLQALVASLAEEHLVAPPGTAYKYSNLDYAVLGRVLEEVEGRSYPEAMAARFAAWGLASTSVGTRPELAARLAEGYRGGVRQKRLALRDTSAGSVVSSALDLAGFLSAVFAGRVAGAEAMLAPQYEGRPLDFGHRVGLGWMLSGLQLPGGAPLAWHDGAYPPFTAAVAMLPGEKLGVVLLSNSDEASSFLDAVAIDALELARELRTGEARPGPSTVAAPPVHLDRAALDALAGRYVIFNGQPTAIDREGDALAVTLSGQRLTLVPTAADTFAPRASALGGLVQVPVTGLTVQFQQVEGRDFAVLRGLPAPFPFERIPPVSLDDTWRARLGPYGGDRTELFDFSGTALREEAGGLQLDLTLSGGRGTGALALRPVSATEAVVVGAGASEGNTVTARTVDGREELVVSGFHFRR